jgi:tRNA1Val (adenine37-N6)-methyltransferase
MGRNTYFEFKQFKIIQEESAMKVNTDGVLLGAWVNTSGVEYALDVGTGTGLIALMLAQRSTAEITGIEIEENAAGEAKFNAANSQWGNRIKIQNISFQEYAANNEKKFELIISNPPYYTKNKKSATTNRSIARHNDLLPFPELISFSLKLLNKKGRLCIIVPAQSSLEISNLAYKKDLFLKKLTEVKSNPETPAIRCLMEFSKTKTALQKDCLSIFKSRSEYSEEYKNLTKDFYLNF